jgi:sporulation protein YlmC with PRC-barrel domain
MRLSELLSSEVIDRNGQPIGHVHDVQLIQDGPPLGTWGAALCLDALVVGRGSVGTRLGVARPEVRGPWILKVLFARRRSSRILIPWDRVREIGDERITVDCVADECRRASNTDEADQHQR